MATFHPSEILAIAYCLKDATIKAARCGFVGKSGSVDLRVRIHGVVTKDHDSPEQSVETPAVVSLENYNAFCTVLRLLGIGSTRLAKALANLPIETRDDPELRTLFEQAADRMASTMPPQQRITAARSGSVKAALTVERIESGG